MVEVGGQFEQGSDADAPMPCLRLPQALHFEVRPLGRGHLAAARQSGELRYSLGLLRPRLPGLPPRLFFRALRCQRHALPQFGQLFLQIHG